jgi:hypothetical protein
LTEKWRNKKVNGKESSGLREIKKGKQQKFNSFEESL